jgi:hypothetical protein
LAPDDLGDALSLARLWMIGSEKDERLVDDLMMARERLQAFLMPWRAGGIFGAGGLAGAKLVGEAFGLSNGGQAVATRSWAPRFMLMAAAFRPAARPGGADVPAAPGLFHAAVEDAPVRPMPNLSVGTGGVGEAGLRRDAGGAARVWALPGAVGAQTAAGALGPAGDAWPADLYRPAAIDGLMGQVRSIAPGLAAREGVVRPRMAMAMGPDAVAGPRAPAGDEATFMEKYQGPVSLFRPVDVGKGADASDAALEAGVPQRTEARGGGAAASVGMTPGDDAPGAFNLDEQLADFFCRQARMPPASGGAFDPHLTPAWFGQKQSV